MVFDCLLVVVDVFEVVVGGFRSFLLLVTTPSGCTKVFFRKIFPVTVKRFYVISLSGRN